MTRATENRQRIITVTASLFNTRGYAGTSMSDVLEATGLHKGSVYLCFPSKDDLALAVFDYSVRMMLTKFDEAFQKAGARSIDQLLAFVDVYANLKDEAPFVGGCPVLNAAIESDDAYPFLRDRVAEALRQWQDLLGNIVKRGITRGEFATSTDPEQMANLIIAGIEGALMMVRLLRDPTPMRQMLEHLRGQIRALCVNPVV